MTVYGLIGRTLSHSFSQKYFRDKFREQNITDHDYELLELETIQEFPNLVRERTDIKGFNVTIPYKQEVIPYMDAVDPTAQKIGAVNVIKRVPDGLKGFNSDYFGFRTSLVSWMGESSNPIKALVLGTGGAAQAVWAVLEDLEISFQQVSRSPGENRVSYQDLWKDPDWALEYKLLINTTPLGTHPDVDQAPDLDYSKLGNEHFLYDLIYNPAKSKFLASGEKAGSRIKNGLEMLELQAEKSWEIWNSEA